VTVTERRIVRRFSALKPVFAERPLRLTAPAGLHGARRTASRDPGVMTTAAARSAAIGSCSAAFELRAFVIVARLLLMAAPRGREAARQYRTASSVGPIH